MRVREARRRRHGGAGTTRWRACRRRRSRWPRRSKRWPATAPWPSASGTWATSRSFPSTTPRTTASTASSASTCRTTTGPSPSGATRPRWCADIGLDQAPYTGALHRGSGSLHRGRRRRALLPLPGPQGSPPAVLSVRGVRRPLGRPGRTATPCRSWTGAWARSSQRCTDEGSRRHAGRRDQRQRAVVRGQPGWAPRPQGPELRGRLPRAVHRVVARPRSGGRGERRSPR